MRPNPQSPSPDGQPPMQQQGWFARNWKWLVPVGCLVPMVCCGGIGAVAYFGASKMIEGSAPFVSAIALASENAEVKAKLGTPLKTGFGMQGSFNESNGNGTADFSMPVEGPKAKGTLRVKGSSRNGQWTYSVMEVEVGGQHIDLREKAEELPPPDDSATDEPADPDGD